MHPTIHNLTIAVAAVGLKTLELRNHHNYNNLPLNLDSYFESLRSELPQFSQYIDSAIELSKHTEKEQLAEIAKLVNSIFIYREDFFPPDQAIWKLLKYVSMFNNSFSYLQQPVADSVHHYLVPVRRSDDSRARYFCFGDVSFTSAFSLALAGNKVDFVPFTSSISPLIPFLNLVIQFHNKHGEIVCKERWNFDKDFSWSEESSYEGAFIYPNVAAQGFDIYPFLKNSPNYLIFIVPSAFLWTNTLGNKMLRKELTESRRLKTIVLLPPNSVTDSSSLFALLLIEKNSKNNEIWFIDKSAQKIFSNKKKSIHDSISMDREKIQEVCVPNELVKENSYLLDPKRYIIRQNSSLFKFNTDEFQKLEEIVEIIRAQEPEQNIDDWAEKKFELSPSDIDVYSGLCKLPEKTIFITEKGLKRAAQASLKIGDVLLNIKSNNFKCGLWNHKEKNTIAGASFLILRLKPEYLTKIPPFYLLRYLRSSEVKEYFSCVSTGETAQLLKMQDVKKLPVPLPSTMLLNKEYEKFVKQVLVSTEIHRLKQEALDISEFGPID